MNICDYLEKYTGYGINVTIIDTGVIISKKNIHHYKISCDDITKNDYSSIKSTHGTMCAEAILRIAPDVQIFDICVEIGSGIYEQDIIKALDFAYSRLESDIICICLSLENYSSELFEVINKFENTFIIAAGYKDKVSYPADLNNVIKVYFDSTVDNFAVVSKNIISSNYCYNNYSGNSLACAYIVGVFSVVLEAKSLWVFDDINNYIFASNDNQTTGSITLTTKMPDRFIASFPLKYLKFRNNFKKNLVGYFSEDMKIRMLNDETLFKAYSAVFINPYEHNRTISEKKQENYYVGKYIGSDSHNKISLFDHYSLSSDYVCDIKQPIIAIASYGYGSSKFDSQLRLFNSIVKLNYRVLCSTYNPLGILFDDFIVFEYPKIIECPDIIYSINKTIYGISINDDIDLLILNIGGSIREINFHNSYNMGMLFECYMKAFRIDILILCVTVNISISAILFEIDRLKAAGIAEVIIVVSENQYDEGTYDSATGMKYHKCNYDKQKAYANELKKEFNPNMVFLLSELSSIGRVKTILEHLT